MKKQNKTNDSRLKDIEWYKNEFIELYLEHFQKHNKYSVIFEAISKGDELSKVLDIRDKFEKIANYLFNEKSIWIRLIIWDEGIFNKNDLYKCGYTEENLNFSKGCPSDKIFQDSFYEDEILKNSEIQYIYYEKYDYKYLLPFVIAISNFELGFEPSASISAFFMTFDGTPILLNFPDDRFIELCTDSDDLINSVKNKFESYQPKVYTN